MERTYIIQTVRGVNLQVKDPRTGRLRVEHVDHCTPVQRTVEDLGVREEDPVDSLLPGPPGQPALFRVHQTDRTPPRANPQAVANTLREAHTTTTTNTDTLR